MSEHVPNSDSDNGGAQPPDIDRVVADDWPERAFPIDDGRRENSVRVVVKQSVLNDIHQHGQSTTDVEICGVLVGAGYRDDRGPFVYVEANIRGQHSDSKAAQVTFTGETWNHIHNELDRDYPDLQILGWYHTHPGFGVFLSGMDLFIHENYFSGEHQLALVYDPIGGDEGLFVWRGGKAVRDGFLIEPDAKENPPPVAGAPPSEPLTAGAASESDFAEPRDSDLQARLARIERRQALADIGVFVAVALALAIPVLIWRLWIEPRLPPPGAPALHENVPPATRGERLQNEQLGSGDSAPADAPGKDADNDPREADSATTTDDKNNNSAADTP